ncbi:hypothetical protein [Acidovorax sp.]|uniref:hypothetical protein n=1 Tax=Acidovorax sp. TaxID=1872122 RepID=UPI00391F97B4
MDWSRFELVDAPGVSDADVDWSGFELVALGPGDGVQQSPSSRPDAAPTVPVNDGWRPSAARPGDAPVPSIMADAPPVARSIASAASKAPARKGLLGRLGDEFTQLRDEVFAGATNASANLQAMNASAAAHQLLQRQEMLAQLVGEGRGDSTHAQGLRTYIAHASQRLGGMAVDTAEAGALADAASRMTTRPQVRAVLEAKIFGEAWEVFKKDPYAVVAGVTAQSAAQMIPMVVAAATMGPVAGAAVAGGTSALTEFGSGIREFARDNGVDPSDKEGLGRLFADPKMLREATAYAGTGGAIVGTMDAVSGGVASKTLVPKVLIKNPAVRQAINVPLQVGVQGALGGAGEAGKQLAQKGEIDQPGQVLAEVAGELGGVHNPLRETSANVVENDGRRADGLPVPRVPAQTAAPTAPVGSPGTAARNSYANGLGAVASSTAGEETRAVTDGDLDVSEAPTGHHADVGTFAQPVEATGGQQLLATVPGSHESAPQGETALGSPADVAVAPFVGAVRLTDKGTLSVEGDPRALEAFLGKAGVDKVFLFDRRLLVAPEQAAQAQQALAALPLSLPGHNGMGVPPAAPVSNQVIELASGMLAVRGDPDAIEAALLAGGVRGARRFAKGTMVPVQEAALARAVMSAPAEGVETIDTPGPSSEPRRLQLGVVGHDHRGQGRSPRAAMPPPASEDAAAQEREASNAAPRASSAADVNAVPQFPGFEGSADLATEVIQGGGGAAREGNRWVQGQGPAAPQASAEAVELERSTENSVVGGRGLARSLRLPPEIERIGLSDAGREAFAAGFSLGIGLTRIGDRANSLAQFARAHGSRIYNARGGGDANLFGSPWPGSDEALERNISLAMEHASEINVNLDGVLRSLDELPQVLKLGEKGIGHRRELEGVPVGNVTNWEIWKIMKNESYRMKSNFFFNGSPVEVGP